MAALSSVPKVLQASVILFPGQGSQYVGMAKTLCARAQSLFEMANQVLGYDLLKLCRDGPVEELDKTIHSQPAVFVSSLAAVENLADMSKGAVERCIATAGFSIGEFAALVLAQSIDFVDALRLIKIRAEVTQALSESVPSGMMTVIYGNNSNLGQVCQLAHEYCARSGIAEDEAICSITNHLFPHAKVIGGHQKALDFVETNGKDFGIRRTKRLAVSGAFHTRLMKPAAEDLKKAVDRVNIKQPKIKVYSNVDASSYTDVAQIKKSIAIHVYKPVLWQQIMQQIYSGYKKDEGLPITFECGPQNNMTTMLAMVNLKARKLSYNIE